VSKRAKKVAAKTQREASSRDENPRTLEWGEDLNSKKLGFNDFASSLLANVEQWLGMKVQKRE